MVPIASSRGGARKTQIIAHFSDRLSDLQGSDLGGEGCSIRDPMEPHRSVCVGRTKEEVSSRLGRLQFAVPLHCGGERIERASVCGTYSLNHCCEV